jgi:hypothetical protein
MTAAERGSGPLAGLPCTPQLASFLIEHDYLNGEAVRMDGAPRTAAR